MHAYTASAHHKTFKGVPAPVTLLSTGLGSNGVPVNVGQLDPRWKVSGPGYSGRAVVITKGTFSGLIGPKNHGSVPPGLYIYQLDVNLTVSPDELEIVLQFSADDTITSFTVNDVAQPLPVLGTSFRLGTPYVLRGWKKGNNWIRVGVFNQGNSNNPTYFRVEATGLSKHLCTAMHAVDLRAICL